MIAFNKVVWDVSEKNSRKELEFFYLRMACGYAAEEVKNREGSEENSVYAKAYAEALTESLIERMKRESSKTAEMVSLAKKVAYDWADLETFEQRDQVEAHLECNFGDESIEKVGAIARMICGEA